MKAMFVALIAVCMLSSTLAQRNGRMGSGTNAPETDPNAQNDHPTPGSGSGRQSNSKDSKSSGHDLPTHYDPLDLTGHGIISLSGQFCGDLDNLLMQTGVKPYEDVDADSWKSYYIGYSKRWLMYNLKTACQTCPCCVPATALGEVCGFKDGKCSAWVQLDINGVLLQFNANECDIAVDKRGVGLITLDIQTPGFAAIEDVRLALGLVGDGFARVQWLDGITLSGTLERNLALTSSYGKDYDYEYSTESKKDKDKYVPAVKCDVQQAQDACTLNCGDLLSDKAGGIQMAVSALQSILQDTCGCIYVKDGKGWGSWSTYKPAEISEESWSSGKWGSYSCIGECCEAECCKALSDFLQMVGPCINLVIAKLSPENQEKLALLLDYEFQKQNCPCPFSLPQGSAICYHKLPAAPKYYKIWCKSCYGYGVKPVRPRPPTWSAPATTSSAPAWEP